MDKKVRQGEPNKRKAEEEREKGGIGLGGRKGEER